MVLTATHTITINILGRCASETEISRELLKCQVNLHHFVLYEILDNEKTPESQ
jgi:hypothetical protein